MKVIDNIVDRLRQYIIRRLDQPVETYERRVYNNLRHLYKYIRKGDVVLVEGRSEVSRIIKLLSQSHWSHSALYVGDELIKRHRPDREKYLEQFGEDARHLVIEAFPSTGVIASPLRKYIDYNIRVCRPYGIHKKDLQIVIEDVISNLGKQYDQENIIDIALMLLPSWFNRFKPRSVRARLGSGDEFQVICSGMIARAFQRVCYPIVPVLVPPSENGDKVSSPYGAGLLMRHYTQILPRDFDLSPNFEIIKFNIIKAGKFRYRELPWEAAEPEEDLPRCGTTPKSPFLPEIESKNRKKSAD